MGDGRMGASCPQQMMVGEPRKCEHAAVGTPNERPRGQTRRLCAWLPVFPKVAGSIACLGKRAIRETLASLSKRCKCPGVEVVILGGGSEGQALARQGDNPRASVDHQNQGWLQIRPVL